MGCSNEESMTMADLIQKGVSRATSDDTKSMTRTRTRKGAGVDWSDPEGRTRLASCKLAVSGDQRPMLVYANREYGPDDPWSQLFKNQILVWGFNYMFTSPSLVEQEAKAA